MANVLVAGWIGSTNLGDELAFAGLRQLLADRDVRVAAISTAPAATRRVHGVGAVDHTDVTGLVQAIRRADAMVFGGGGIVQDVTSPLNLPYHLSRVVTARTVRTPFAGVGLGIGGVGTTIGRFQVRHALRGAVAITVRDEASRDLLARIGAPDADVASDLAFALPPPEGGTDDGPLVVSLRPWTTSRSLRPAASRGDTTEASYVRALGRALDRAAQDLDVPVRFVALQHDRDDAFHRRVAATMRAPVTFAVPGLHELLEAFADARAVVSMRYHGGVAAVLAGRPVVLVSYADKVDALAAELGDDTVRLGWDAQEIDELPRALRRVADRGAGIVAVRERLRGRQGANIAALAALLDAAS